MRASAQLIASMRASAQLYSARAGVRAHIRARAHPKNRYRDKDVIIKNLRRNYDT